MSLRSRLAHRSSTTASIGSSIGGARSGSSGETASVGLGFRCETWRISTTRPLGRGSVWPVGFESLVVPERETLVAGLAEVASLEEADGPPIVAIDLETSGGLGRNATPFIVGAAWHEARHQVCVVQWTLVEPSAEASMLYAVWKRLSSLYPGGGGPRLLTFNGAPFDLPVLRARMQRLLRQDLELRAHVDLLVATRRLWSSALPNCRLGTLERRVLNASRVGDMEGAEVAEVFPQLIASPHDPWVCSQLARAQRHNRGDVVALLVLAATVGQRLVMPENASEVLRAARHYVQQGRGAVARTYLESLVPRRSQLGASQQRELGGLLGELYRRGGQREAAAQQWRWLCDRFPGDVEAHERLAKHLEHEVRDYAEALRVTMASHLPCPKRVARLRQKLLSRG